MVIKTSDGEFKVTLVVDKDVDEGTYILYVVASPDGKSFDLSRDPYTMLTVTVIPIGVLKYPSQIEIVRGTEKRIFIEVNGEPGKDVFVCYTLKGHGVKVTKAADPSKDSVSFGHDNGFTKWNETENGTWWMYVDIYPYYDVENHKLVPSWDRNRPDEVKLLPTGMYDFGIHVYTRDPDSGIFTETSEVSIPLIVKPINLQVDAPSEITKGEDLTIKIKENRVVTTSYDNIYVILDLKTKLRKISRVSLDANGTAEVTIPTADLDPGTYKLYVRDTMGTEKGRIEDYYDIPPTDSYAKNFSADDDAWWFGEIKIVEAAAPTTTVTATATATATTTVAPTTTVVTTTTVAPTTTVAKTTTVTTTVPPTTTKKTPGFEAIFAITGLLAIAYLLRRRQ
jgi:PGF-CTERM protein